MRYIVTGVDGQLSSRIADLMIKEVSGNELTFTCYKLKNVKQDKLNDWQQHGVRVVEANYDDISSLEKAFEGGDRIYIVSGLQVGKRQQQHRNAMDAAVKMGVKHIIYSSFIGATEPEYSKFYVTPDHTASENYLRTLNVTFNTMRNNLYLENYLTMYPMLALMSDNEWCSTARDGKATFVHKDDVARAAAALLLGKGEDNVSYNICGEEAISVREICEIVSKASGIDFRYNPVNDVEYYKYLAKLNIPELISGDFSRSPVPFCGADIVTNDEAVRDGMLDVKSDAIEKLTGQKPKRAKEIVCDYQYIWEERITNWKDIR